MPLSNMFSNKFDDLIDSFNKEDIISHHQNRNAMNPQLLATGKNRVTTHSKLKERMEDVKRDTSDESFLC